MIEINWPWTSDEVKEERKITKLKIQAKEENRKLNEIMTNVKFYIGEYQQEHGIALDIDMEIG